MVLTVTLVHNPTPLLEIQENRLIDFWGATQVLELPIIDRICTASMSLAKPYFRLVQKYIFTSIYPLRSAKINVPSNQ